MPVRQYRQLGELRAEMRAMVGAASSGAAAGPNATLVDTHLRNAQNVLYWSHDWVHMRYYFTASLGMGATLTDYPTEAGNAPADCNPDRVKAISIFRGGVWSNPIPRGIRPSMYTYQANASWPQRWEPYLQIETWPQADQVYPMRIFYIAQLAPLVADADRFSIDDGLVSIVATATLKAHYRQPDAEIHVKMSDQLLTKLKSKSFSKDVFRPDDWTDQEPLVKPVVV